ncbi:MAG: hypothetical protein M1834_007966 [Cirrosporium novae-zelandiae]|nr:MAG: hypothetical protein M1834_007966 [Cirrosporium novae-zelandiae]
MSPTSFLDLPREIRDKIYDLLVFDVDDIKIDEYGHFSYRRNPLGTINAVPGAYPSTAINLGHPQLDEEMIQRFFALNRFFLEGWNMHREPENSVKVWAIRYIKRLGVTAAFDEWYTPEHLRQLLEWPNLKELEIMFVPTLSMEVDDWLADDWITCECEWDEGYVGRMDCLKKHTHTLSPDLIALAPIIEALREKGISVMLWGKKLLTDEDSDEKICETYGDYWPDLAEIDETFCIMHQDIEFPDDWDIKYVLPANKEELKEETRKDIKDRFWYFDLEALGVVDGPAAAAIVYPGQAKKTDADSSGSPPAATNKREHEVDEGDTEPNKRIKESDLQEDN